MPYDENTEYDYKMNEFLKCPYCDSNDYEWWELFDDRDLNNDGIEHEIQCMSCDEVYKAVIEIRHFFDTKPLEEK